MRAVITSSVLAFISTNLDDIFVLTLLFAACLTPGQRIKVIAGQLLGILTLTGVSALAALGLQAISPRLISLLGVIPLLIGLKALWALRRSDDNDVKSLPPISLLSVMLLTLAGGGDNLSIYIPVLANSSPSVMLLTAVIFGLMTLVWCLAAQVISRLPFLKDVLARWSAYLVPGVFLLLGMTLLLRAF